MSSALVKAVRADPNYLKFQRILETVRKRVDLDASLKEALGLHASRTSRNITGENRYSPKVIIDASLKDLSFRARLVELRVKNDLQLSTLREAIDAMRRHISTEYSDELRDFPTVDQRRSFVDRVLKNSKEFLAEGEAFLETADALIKDIDQAGHTIRHIIECLKLLSGAQAGKVV
jgi:hypothetical protein